jgi:hypothetical protein
MPGFAAAELLAGLDRIVEGVAEYDVQMVGASLAFLPAKIISISDRPPQSYDHSPQRRIETNAQICFMK